MTERNPDAEHGDDDGPRGQRGGPAEPAGTESRDAGPETGATPDADVNADMGATPDVNAETGTSADTGGPSAEKPEKPEGTETDEAPGNGGPNRRGEVSLPEDEEAAWAAIVAAYGEEPAEPGGSASEGQGQGQGGDRREPDGDTLTKQRPDPADGGDGSGESPVRSFTVYAAGTGPRDWDAPEEDEGHFVPPEPPPLPEADVTTKFAWLAVLGGPLLLLGTILLQQDMTWWIVTLGVGGFLGGFGTLVARMRDGRDDDDWDDPGRGAVV